MRCLVLLILFCSFSSQVFGASMSVKASDLYILKGEEVVFTMTYVPDNVSKSGDENNIPDRIDITLEIDLQENHVHTKSFPIEAGETIIHTYPYTFDTSGYHDVQVSFEWTFIDKDGKETSDRKKLDPVTIGVANWVFNAGGSLGCIESTPLVSVDKTTLYVGSQDHTLYALNIIDGAEKWRFVANGSINSTPAIDISGNLYFGCEDGFVYCLNSLGQIRWKYGTNGPVYSSPAIDEDFKRLYIGSTDKKLYALELDDGSLPWAPFSTGGKITSSPVIGFDNTVYIGSLDHFLYAVKPDGTEKWRFDARSEIVGSPALDMDGTIIFGTAAFGGGINTENGLFAVSTSGNEKWFIQHNSGFFSTPVIGADGTICIGSFSNNLYGTTRTGKSLAMFRSFSDDHMAAAALGTDDYLFCGAKDGIVYGLDLMNGNSYKGRDQFWRFTVEAPITGSSPMISDGYIYLGTCRYDRGGVYSLVASKVSNNSNKIGMEINEDAPWPIFRGNMGNTGKTKYDGDSVSPEVSSVEPCNGETHLDLMRRSITINFSRPMEPESIYKPATGNSNGYYGLTLEPFDSGPEKFNYNLDDPYKCVLTLPENESFKPYITYTATLLSKAKSADMPEGSTDNNVLYTYSWSFSAMDDQNTTLDSGSASSCFISNIFLIER